MTMSELRFGGRRVHKAGPALQTSRRTGPGLWTRRIVRSHLWRVHKAGPALRCVIVALVLSAAPAFAQAPDGAAVFEKACASCHAQPAADSRAPRRDVLALIAPEAIMTAL